jgi:YVTN family beta-propeller protein
VAALALVSSSAAAQDKPTDPAPPAAFASVRLVPIPGRALARCRSIERQARMPILCPTLLPRSFSAGIPGSPPSALNVTPMGTFFARRIAGVDMGYGAPWEEDGWRAHRWRNRPCCFFHFDVFRRARTHRAIPPGARPATLGGKRGLLVPAHEGAFYGNGLYWANHVRFLWRERGVPYVATLHTFGERATERLLGRLIASLRPVDEIPSPRRRGIPVGTTPNGIEFSRGSLWIASLGDLTRSFHGIVYRVDARTAAVTGRFRVTTGAHGLAIANGKLWVPTWRGLARVVVRTGRRLGALDVGKWPRAVVARGGAVWIADAAPFWRPGSLARLDPRTGRISGRVALGRAPVALAIARRTAWVTDELESQVVRVDLARMRVVARILVGRMPTAVRVGAGSVWVADWGASSVSRIDPATNDVTTIPVGLAPRGLAVGAGAVWIACTGDGTIWRIDPATRRAHVAFRGLDAPLALAVADRALWVTTNGNGELVRLPLR